MDISNNFNFYDQTYLKSYNLDKAIQYELSLLDSLDVFTRAHSENVATITCNLCKKLRCSKGYTAYCITCAFLHDIGKLFIPPEILQKPGKLTDEEYEIMKKHTTLGYDLCKKDPKLSPYSAGVYYHHEALDGTGYPQGLVKKDIPFEAQIIKVADEYDALVHKRQYKTHVGISESLKIIIEKTKPSSDAPKNTGFTDAGKNNKLVVKKLLKVVIDDIEYEISSTMDYVKHLKKELNRLKQIVGFIEKSKNEKKEDKRVYYEQYAKMLLHSDESIDKIEELINEYENAYNLRQNVLKKLFEEIKIIKKLKV